MTRDDARLAAVLTILRDQLAPVVDELLGGELALADRRRLAAAFRIVANDLDKVVPVAPSELVGLLRASAANTDSGPQ